jgi:hypothetical protein
MCLLFPQRRRWEILSEKLTRSVARMPGLTSLIEDQNAVIREMKDGFLSLEDYHGWIIRAASLSLGKWPEKGDNIFENRNVMSLLIGENREYDPEMSNLLRFELTKHLIDIYQDAQASIIPKMIEEDTSDKFRRNKMEGIK